MVVLPDHCKAETILAIFVSPQVTHVDLELGMGNPKLHIEVNAFGPGIKASISGREQVPIFIWTRHLETASKRLRRQRSRSFDRHCGILSDDHS